MSEQALNPLDVIEGASVNGRKGAFILGCYDQRITFYSQQVRALALVHALADQDYLKGSPRIAVIGGGAAGLSAAAALVLASSGQVVLFEGAQNLLKLQSGTNRRKLDPHIYNWPRPNATDQVAELPILDWEAGPSTEVREDIVRQFDDIVVRTGDRLTKQMRTRISAVNALDSGYELTVHNVDTGAVDAERFQMVFLAFGFGLEAPEEIKGIKDRSYWDNGGMPSAEFQGRPNPHYFVSGNGDGGLIDLVAAASANFDHGEMIHTITSHPGLKSVMLELLSIEKAAREARSAGVTFDIHDAYETRLGTLVDATGLVKEIRRRLRAGVRLTLQTRDPALFSLESAILNRFAVFVTMRACLTHPGCSFNHRHCHNVSRVDDYVADPGEAPYQLDCDGDLIEVDEVIIRRGTDKATVRQPFAAILDDYEVQHQIWLKRLGEITLIPTLSSDAQIFYRTRAAAAYLPGSQRRIRLAQAAMPVFIHLSESSGQISWAGDITPEQIADAWGPKGAFYVTMAQGPDEMGAIGGAILRVASHASQLKVHADPMLWSERWKELTVNSLHATGISMPQVVGGNPGGAARLRIKRDAARLATVVHRHLDAWMLTQLDEHIRNFTVSEADPGNAIRLSIAPDLRALMHTTWERWFEALEHDRDLLGRFLRLMISATDEDDDAIQLLVGPRKLDSIICGTALTLAVASALGETGPHASRPGNLLHRFESADRTGHGCAADLIVGRRARYSAQSHDWKTNFVLLALEGALDVARQADVTFASIEGSQPALTETTGSGPLMMWISQPLMDAMEKGVGALAALLKQMERIREETLVAAIERNEVAV